MWTVPVRFLTLGFSGLTDTLFHQEAKGQGGGVKSLCFELLLGFLLAGLPWAWHPKLKVTAPFFFLIVTQEYSFLLILEIEIGRDRGKKHPCQRASRMH